MARTPFTFSDIAAECTLVTGCYTLHGHNSPRRIGARITVPPALMSRYPYNGSAYDFLQCLRTAIFEFGTIEFPDLPVNRQNHTLAQRAPQEHSYSSNPYLTGSYQHPHQDTPPYPTAFWLGAPRRFSATWVMSLAGLQAYADMQRTQPGASVESLHRQLVPASLANGTGILLNQQPGLLLIDNSEHQQLYHARTANRAALAQHPGPPTDTPMYAFNEIGLLHYIDTLDEQRGQHDRDEAEQRAVAAFLAQEQHTGRY